MDAARATVGRAMEIARDGGDKRGEATALWWLGKADLATGNLDAASISLGGALRAFQAFDMFAELIGCLEDHAELLNSVGNAAGVGALCARGRAVSRNARPPADTEGRAQVAGGRCAVAHGTRRCFAGVRSGAKAGRGKSGTRSIARSPQLRAEEAAIA